MKQLILFLILLISVSIQAQNSFVIDVANDSIISVSKYQHTNNKWRMEIIMYEGLTDTLGNNKGYSMYVRQEDTKPLMDTLVSNIYVQFDNQEAAIISQWEKQKSTRDRAILQMAALRKRFERTSRNKAKMNAIKL